MNKAEAQPFDPEVTRHDMPVLCRPPLAERLPRLNCAPDWAPTSAPEGPQHVDPSEQTLIGEVPGTLPRTTSPPRNASPLRNTSRVPTDRWLLLIIAFGTLAYSMRSLAPETALQTSSTPRAVTSLVAHSRSAALFRVATEAAPELLPKTEPPTQIETPWDAAALETAAARAWFAGHNDEAALLYKQLAALSPQSEQYKSAVAILCSRGSVHQPEPNP
ncbi:MAG TPA: hypothetical protein VHO25_16125 [Polyangiaceae bacterium]|nr:hypothetical protein [Polyangiaceae bacterium]